MLGTVQELTISPDRPLTTLFLEIRKGKHKKVKQFAHLVAPVISPGNLAGLQEAGLLTTTQVSCAHAHTQTHIYTYIHRHIYIHIHTHTHPPHTYHVIQVCEQYRPHPTHIYLTPHSHTTLHPSHSPCTHAPQISHTTHSTTCHNTHTRIHMHTPTHSMHHVQLQHEHTIHTHPPTYICITSTPHTSHIHTHHAHARLMCTRIPHTHISHLTHAPTTHTRIHPLSFPQIRALNCVANPKGVVILLLLVREFQEILRSISSPMWWRK